MEYVGNILYDKKLMDRSKKFVIFGAGICGCRILKYMDLNGVKGSIICFCDSNTQTGGQYIEEIPVRQVKDVISQYPDAEYLIAGKYTKEMYQILDQSSVRKIHILFV